jgi:gamma-glutamylcyclotransferase
VGAKSLGSQGCVNDVWGRLDVPSLSVKFFAVGTNMDEERMRALAPSARCLTVGHVSGFELRWHKRSDEGGKLSPLGTGDAHDLVWGVLYELDAQGWQEVDAAQRAAGYRAKSVGVAGTDGFTHEASMYIARADMVDDSILPTASYRDPIVNAARAQGLPPKYIAELARTPVADS